MIAALIIAAAVLALSNAWLLWEAAHAPADWQLWPDLFERPPRP